ncbi:glycosyltransferase family 9 protein [Oceanibaculum pacificum]|uniref:Heptosyltransferase n=1 Tax=Oceanibaculum pacificum TaxID=580166 RepID=A0A154W3R4_9PROT|nr:glycosyltransferase family 9 protein [Oceanibaculum pacificum]KZD08190.1 hypothetical protein AUP43_08820 [Oceanibaculum pacificum]
MADFDSVAIYSGGEIIGDGVYKLPFLRALRSSFPRARLTWICPSTTVYKDRIAPLATDLLDEILAEAPLGRSPLELLRPVRLRQRYDVVIDTQQIVWRSLCARRLRHGLFVSGAAQFRLSERKPPAGYERPDHILQRFNDLIALVTGVSPGLDRSLRLPESLMAKAAAQLPDGAAYVGFAPGAGQAVKRWPLERFVDLAQRQAARGRVPVFILGPAEMAELPAIREAVPTALFPEQDIALWGAGFDPMRTMAIGRRMAGAVTNDSGVSHMLAAADTPLTVLYGPTSAEKFGPVTRRAHFIQAERFGASEMAAIPTDAVDTALEALLTASPDNP